MDCFKNDPLLILNEDTILSIRKEYDLDKPGFMDQSIDILVEWLKKQEHFLMKDFPRDYLERKIIFSLSLHVQVIPCKGSLERVKTQLDRTCVFRTISPMFYENVNFKTDYEESDVLLDALLPKLTEDHYRIYYLKNIGKKFENGFMNYYRFVLSLMEYILAHDYCKGIIIIFDLTEADVIEVTKNLSFSDVRQIFNLLIEAYGMRIKGIHVVYPSKTVEIFIALLKQVLSAKVAGRIQIHRNVESLHKFFTKTILPNEAGGNAGSMKELHEKWVNAISSEEFQEVYNKIKEAKTNEDYRQLDKFRNEYLGTAGTFRCLNVD